MTVARRDDALEGRRTRLLAVVLAVVGLAVSSAACGGSSSAQETAAATRERATTEEEAVTEEEVAHERPRAQGREVDLNVVSGPGGVFAFVEVFIRGKGPFSFTVDTGASNSVLDWDVARTIGVKTIGKPVTVTGIACRGQAGRARVAKWRLADVALPKAEIQTIDMPEPGGGIVIDGLLGSDILSTFGAVTIDYEAERLVLAEHAG